MLFSEINMLNSQNDPHSKSSSQSNTPVQTQKKSVNKESPASCKNEFVDRNGLEKYLKSLSISYQVQDHEEVFTVDALMRNVREMPGLHMKNLFLKDKKKNLYLLSARHNTEVCHWLWQFAMLWESVFFIGGLFVYQIVMVLVFNSLCMSTSVWV